jgi:hypothetical protein
MQAFFKRNCGLQHCKLVKDLINLILKIILRLKLTQELHQWYHFLSGRTAHVKLFSQTKDDIFTRL